MDFTSQHYRSSLVRAPTFVHVRNDQRTRRKRSITARQNFTQEK